MEQRGVMEQGSQLAVGETVKEVHRLFESRGSAWYGGEAVSQLEHALQAAMFAERDAATAELIVAALLHDVGHLLHDLPENVAEQGVDDRHEMLARPWLSKRFSPAVVEPVEMHVAAKRYLCAVDADYMLLLSPASQQSLQLQGGPMSGDEVSEFGRRSFFADAVRLRKWDDAAKVVGMKTPPLEHFGSYIGCASLVTTP
jgi:phosphonate degradation associated HDIG domain protein